MPDETWDEFNKTDPDQSAAFMRRLDAIPGVRRLNPVPNNDDVIFNPGDRVVHEHTDGAKGVVLKAYPPGTARTQEYLDWLQVEPGEPPWGLATDRWTYDVQWDHRLNPRTYELESPGEVAPMIDGTRLWPEGDVRLDMAYSKWKKQARTTMYHVTVAQNRDKIRAEGLKSSRQDAPSAWPDSPSRPDGVYLWDNMESADKYARRNQMFSDPEFWGVDVTGLNLQEDPYFKIWDSGYEPVERDNYRGPHGIPGAFVTLDDIPPDKMWLHWANPWFPEDKTAATLSEMKPGEVILDDETTNRISDEQGIKAYIEGEPIGNITYQVFDNDYVYVHWVFVKPEYQNQGVMREMFNEIYRRYNLPISGEFFNRSLEAYVEKRNLELEGVTSEQPWNRQSNIFDPIEQTLDQDIFKGIEPRPTILQFIERLYYRALDQGLGVQGDQWADLYLTGSLTTYQYSNTSDADISVFPDYDLIYQELGLDDHEARQKLVALSIEHLDGVFLPGTTHPLQFFVQPKGLLPGDTYQSGLRAGYSFGDRQWFVPPEKNRVHDIALEYPELYARAAAMADKMTQMLDAGNDEAADQLWKDIHKKRQLDQRAELGDFCEGNIVYKWFLNQGLFDRIRNELHEYIAKTSIFIDPEDEYFAEDTPTRRYEYWRTFWIDPKEFYPIDGVWFVRILANPDEVEVGDHVQVKWESPNGRQKMDGIIEYLPSNEMSDESWTSNPEDISGYSTVVRLLPDSVEPLVYAKTSEVTIAPPRTDLSDLHIPEDWGQTDSGWRAYIWGSGWLTTDQANQYLDLQDQCFSPIGLTWEAARDWLREHWGNNPELMTRLNEATPNQNFSWMYDPGHVRGIPEGHFPIEAAIEKVTDQVTSKWKLSNKTWSSTIKHVDVGLSPEHGWQKSRFPWVYDPGTDLLVVGNGGSTHRQLMKEMPDKDHMTEWYGVYVEDLSADESDIYSGENVVFIHYNYDVGQFDYESDIDKRLIATLREAFPGSKILYTGQGGDRTEYVSKTAVEWNNNELDPRELDNLDSGMERWERLEQQVIELASRYDAQIEWLKRGQEGVANHQTFYDATKGWEPGQLKHWSVVKFPHITGERSYFAALHEIGHAAFDRIYDQPFNENSAEEELWAWHFALENAQIPFGEETLRWAHEFFKGYDQDKMIPQESPTYPGWLKTYDHLQMNIERAFGDTPPMNPDYPAYSKWIRVSAFSDLRPLMTQWWWRKDSNGDVAYDVAKPILQTADKYLAQNFQNMTYDEWIHYKHQNVLYPILEAWKNLPKEMEPEYDMPTWENLKPEWQRLRNEQEYREQQSLQRDRNDFYRKMDIGDMQEKTDMFWEWTEYWSMKILEESVKRIKPSAYALQSYVNDIRQAFQEEKFIEASKLSREAYLFVNDELADYRNYRNRIYWGGIDQQAFKRIEELLQGRERLLNGLEHSFNDLYSRLADMAPYAQLMKSIGYPNEGEFDYDTFKEKIDLWVAMEQVSEEDANQTIEKWNQVIEQVDEVWKLIAYAEKAVLDLQEAEEMPDTFPTEWLSKVADLWDERVTTKVIYDFDNDKIILGTQATQAAIPDSKIIGEYDGGIVILYDADKQWINPTYFRRLWHFSYPEHELTDVYYKRGEEPIKLRTIRRRSAYVFEADEKYGMGLVRDKKYAVIWKEHLPAQICTWKGIYTVHGEPYMSTFWIDGDYRKPLRIMYDHFVWMVENNMIIPIDREGTLNYLPWSDDEQDYYRTSTVEDWLRPGDIVNYSGSTPTPYSQTTHDRWTFLGLDGSIAEFRSDKGYLVRFPAEVIDTWFKSGLMKIEYPDTLPWGKDEQDYYRTSASRFKVGDKVQITSDELEKSPRMNGVIGIITEVNSWHDHVEYRVKWEHPEDPGIETIEDEHTIEQASSDHPLKPGMLVEKNWGDHKGETGQVIDVGWNTQDPVNPLPYATVMINGTPVWDWASSWKPLVSGDISGDLWPDTLPWNDEEQEYYRNSSNLTVVCAWCNRIQQPDGTWLPGTPTTMITHGICPDCAAKMRAGKWVMAITDDYDDDFEIYLEPSFEIGQRVEGVHAGNSRAGQLGYVLNRKDDRFIWMYFVKWDNGDQEYIEEYLLMPSNAPGIDPLDTQPGEFTMKDLGIPPEAEDYYRTAWKLAGPEDFVDFFDQASRGEYAPQTYLNPSFDNPDHQMFHDTYKQFAGNFDQHIETSIPGYRELQVKKGTAITQAFPGASVLDIGGSEGSWAKAVSTIGGNRTVNLDPNAAMIEHYRKNPVENAEIAPYAFLEGFEHEGIQYPRFDPGETYDIVNESMTFQFISPNRALHVMEVKRLLSDDGLFLTDEKVITDNWEENERTKDAWKSQFYTQDQISDKQDLLNVSDDEQIVGLVGNMVHHHDLEVALESQFAVVHQYWSSGNFVAYACSNNHDTVNAFLEAFHAQ